MSSRVECAKCGKFSCCKAFEHNLAAGLYLADSYYKDCAE